MNKSGAFFHYFFMQSFDHVRRGGMLSRSSAPLTFDAIYPVGSIITTTDPYFNPNNALGWSGTWERLNRKCFLYQDVEHPGKYAGQYEKTYNCSSTVLTTDQMPYHSHALALWCDADGNHTHTTTSTVTSDNGLHHHNVNGDTESVQGHFHTLDLYTVGYPDETSCHSHAVYNRGYNTIKWTTGTGNVTSYPISRQASTQQDWDQRWITPDPEWFDDHTELGLTDQQIYDYSGGHQHRVAGNTSFHEGHDHAIDLDTTNAGTHNHTIPSLLTNDSGTHNHDIGGTALAEGSNYGHNHTVTTNAEDFQHYNCIFWVRTA